MNNEREKAYLAQVGQIVNSGKGPVEVVDALAAIDVSNKDGFSLNTLNIINYIDGLDFAREEGELEGGDTDSKSYKETEQSIAEGILDRVKHILADIDKGNWYRHKYSVDFVYSRLKDGVYSYRNTIQPLDVTTKDAAERQKEQLRHAAAKTYGKEPEFTLEDVRVNAELVDSNGKHIN